MLVDREAFTCKRISAGLDAGDGNINGFGLEFYIESQSNEIPETIHDVKKSWQFQLLYTVSQLAAGKMQANMMPCDSLQISMSYNSGNLCQNQACCRVSA